MFIVVILVMLPLLPMTLDADSMLRYQLQNFMSRSLEYTFALAACMTLLLACGTVAFEIRDRHIWHVMSKPVGHFQYLLGKWLGIICLNVCVLAVAGVSVFFYIQYLRTTSTATGIAAEEDRYIVAEELLAARASSVPISNCPTRLIWTCRSRGSSRTIPPSAPGRIAASFLRCGRKSGEISCLPMN